jgi:hypothetical protein
MASSLVVIDNLNPKGCPVLPFENNSPLIVDPDGVVPLPFAPQRLQPIARRDVEIAQGGGIVQVEQLPSRDALQLGWEVSNLLRVDVVEEILGEPVAEALNHAVILS